MRNSPQHNPSEELRALLRELLEGELSATQRSRLEELVLGDTAARDYYLDFLALHAMLFAKGEPAFAAHSLEKQPAHEACEVTAEKRASLNHWFVWGKQHPRGSAMAVASVVILAVVVLMAITPVRNYFIDGSPAPLPGPEEIATLTGTHSIAWQEESNAYRSQQRLRTGDKLSLTAGFVEITYDTGARVVLEGPAEFLVGASDASTASPATQGGFLRQGSLVAHCDTAKSQGFAIRTPGARVVDRGTEFGIEVASDGESSIVVLSGVVDVLPESTAGEMAQGTRLSKDEAVVVASDGRLQRRQELAGELAAVMRERLAREFDTKVQADPASLVVIAYGSSLTGFHDLSRGVPAISASDYADAASSHGVTASVPIAPLQAGFDDPLLLFNGIGGANAYSGAGSVLFADDTPAGSAVLVIDLQSVRSVTAINTYSAHNTTRSHQRYRVYGSATLDPPAADVATGWSFIASVAPPTNSPFDGYVGVNITDRAGSLGNYRYLRFELQEPVTSDTVDNHTTFQEFDIYCDPLPAGDEEP